MCGKLGRVKSIITIPIEHFDTKGNKNKGFLKTSLFLRYPNFFKNDTIFAVFTQRIFLFLLVVSKPLYLLTCSIA